MANLTSVNLTNGVPVSGTGTVSTLDNLVGTAGAGSANVLTVQGNASGTAVPVSGAVTASAGTNLNTSALALDATLTGGTQKSKLVDTAGTNVGTIKAGSTAPATTDTSLVVALNPNSIDLGSGTGGSKTVRMLIDTSQLGSLGATTASASAPVVPATDWVGTTALSKFSAGNYETVAASQTAQVMGSTGGAGDYIDHILVIPASTSPGLVTLLDGATSIPVFVGGASSLSNLCPFPIPLGMTAVTAWKITTGASVSCIGVGKFT
jgi:hypothetical protein